MTEKITVHSVSDLVALVPHVLGFDPSDDLICLAVGGGPTARMNHPHTGDALLNVAAQFGATYRRTPVPVALLSFTDNARDAEDTLVCVGAMIDDVAPVIARVHVSPDGTWRDHATGQSGVLEQDSVTRIAAEVAYAGGTVRRSRSI